MNIIDKKKLLLNEMLNYVENNIDFYCQIQLDECCDVSISATEGDILAIYTILNDDGMEYIATRREQSPKMIIELLMQSKKFEIKPISNSRAMMENYENDECEESYIKDILETELEVPIRDKYDVDGFLRKHGIEID